MTNSSRDAIVYVIIISVPDTIIGSGNSKTVIRRGSFTTVSGRIIVAVKGFTATSNRGQITREDLSILKGLISEARVMQDLDSSRNILKLYGVCKEKLRQGKLQLVLEYCPIGSLVDLLKALKYSDFSSNRYANLDRETLLDVDQLRTTMMQWSMQIASGLEYLSSNTEGE